MSILTIFSSDIVNILFYLVTVFLANMFGMLSIWLQQVTSVKRLRLICSLRAREFV